MADTVLFHDLIEKFPIFNYHVTLIHFRVVLIHYHLVFIHFRVTFTLVRGWVANQTQPWSELNDLVEFVWLATGSIIFHFNQTGFESFKSGCDLDLILKPIANSRPVWNLNRNQNDLHTKMFKHFKNVIIKFTY